MEQLLLLTLSVSIITSLLVGYLLYRSIHSSKKDTSTSVFVDTSVLIDARIVSIAKTGFVPGKLIIPRSVIGELQYMADNADNEKRAKARRGLDVIKELQEVEQITVEILQDGSKADEGVDERLLKLTKERGGYLCTIDYNLNKVAQVEGIQVLNVNELAQQIRIVYLPGDTVTLALTQKGQDSHQAVGHLEDGTMVVVEQSHAYIGKTVEVIVVRSLQTAAGRMIFAKRHNADKVASKPASQTKIAKKPFLQKKTNQTAKQPSPSPAPNASSKHHQNKVTKPHTASKRRPSGRDREESLLDLVNNQ